MKEVLASELANTGKSIYNQVAPLSEQTDVVMIARKS
jgi:hypothetical protein